MTNGTDRPVPVVAFVSGKGGCGKTTLAINFANVVSAAGGNVLIVDLDLNNHGSTGTFAKRLAERAEYLTASSLIEGRLEGEPVEVKDRIELVPAGRPGDPIPPLDRPGGVRELAETVRERILDLAARRGAACVVLDCFCGIDTLTTASLGAADHVVVVNEPDPVTFSGSLHLLKHAREEMAGWERSPAIHVVINRMRPPHTVRSLAYTYRDNLARELREAVLCHIPYNEKIFRSFGQYPFASDLLPGSLFVKKLELLAYALFRGSHDELLKPQVRKWTPRRLRKIYLQSVDPSAVDAEYLVLKLTTFPVFVGAWLLVFGLAFNTISLSPRHAWFAAVVGTASGIAIALFSLVHGFWLATRLSFTLGTFRLRSARALEDRWERVRQGLGSVTNHVTAVLMSIGVGLGLAALVALGANAADYFFNVGLWNDRAAELADRMVDVSLASPARVVDLSGERVGAGAALDGRRLTSLADPPKQLDRVLIVRDTQFLETSLDGFQLSGAHLDGVLFRDCVIGSPASASQPDGERSLVFSDGDYRRVQLVEPKPHPGADYGRIVFEKGIRLEDVSVHVRGGAEVVFETRDLSRVRIVNTDPDDEVGVRVLLDGAPASEITSIGNVSVLPRAQAAALQGPLNSRVEAAERLVRTLRSKSRDVGTELINLSELYILRGTPADLSRARTRLDEALAVTHSPELFHGYELLLALLIEIMRDAPESASAAAERWASWLENGNVPASWSWSWHLWHEQDGLPEEKLRLVRLVEASSPRVEESSKQTANRLAPGEFLDAFRAELRRTEPEAANGAGVYVQVGSSGDLAGLVRWAKRLEGEGREVEIYETRTEGMGRYAVTLGRHAPEEAKRLMSGWLAEDPDRRQALLRPGDTYVRRVYRNGAE